MLRHSEDAKAFLKRKESPIGVLFLGDSITAGCAAWAAASSLGSEAASAANARTNFATAHHATQNVNAAPTTTTVVVSPAQLNIGFSPTISVTVASAAGSFDGDVRTLVGS